MSRRPLVRAVLAGALAALVGGAAADGGARAQSGPHAAPYSIALTALTGPAGADLTIDVERAPGEQAVESLGKVQLKVYDADGSLASVRNLRDVPAPAGSAELALGVVERGRRVEADVHVEQARTFVLRGATTTRLRPDLVVAAVHAPPQTTTSRAIAVTAEIEERNGETGATATATLMLGPTPLAAPRPLTVAAGATESITFEDVRLPTAVRGELTVFVGSASPSETDATNNHGSTTVDVSEHELVPSNVLVPSLGGYGAQFNQHVYSPIPLTNLGPDALTELEEIAKAFEPQFVRIFYNDDWEELRATAPQNLESFRKTVALAHEAGATINITYHTAARARLQPAVYMKRFADEIEGLVRGGLTNVRWITVQNEPNTPGAALTLAQWQALYRALHAELVARGLRDQIQLMGGDLIESSGARDHSVWFDYMAANMGDIVDAYSEHVYWWYDAFQLGGTRRFEFRLRDIRKLVVDDNPPERRKPVYIAEFAVRGLGTATGKPDLANAYHADGTELRRTNLAAFQQLWFNIASAQLGFAGSAKWDLYWGLYDLSSPGNQTYWMVDPTPGGWEVFPTFHALRLLLRTTQRGWQVVRVDPFVRDDWDPSLADELEQELAAYRGPGSEVTVIGLDSRGRLLNDVSPETSSYSVGGLPPSTAFELVLWNADGEGANSHAGEVTTSAAGVARFSVPLHAAFALTTVPVS